MEEDDDYRSIMNWLEKADLRESIINDKLYYWNINFQGTEDNNYNMKEQKKEEEK